MAFGMREAGLLFNWVCLFYMLFSNHNLTWLDFQNHNWPSSKAHLVKAMVLPVVMYGCESWTIKKPEHWRIDALNCGVGEDSRVPWTARRSNQSILKEINPEYSLKDWCWSWSSNTLATWWEELTHWKRSWCWERLKVGRKGDNRGWDGWMVGWHHWLNGHEFE